MVCGEWEVGSVPASWSGEQYNIVLDVLEITPHPLYNVSAGEYFIVLDFLEITPHPLYNVSAGDLHSVVFCIIGASVSIILWSKVE